MVLEAASDIDIFIYICDVEIGERYSRLVGSPRFKKQKMDHTRHSPHLNVVETVTRVPRIR